MFDDTDLIIIIGAIITAFMAVFGPDLIERLRRQKKTLPMKDPIDDDPNPGIY